MNKKGDYIKPEGANWIMFYNGKKWVSCECNGCAIALGLIIPSQRVSASNHKKIAKLLGYKFKIKHDAGIHNEWIRKGKPIK
jgi:hypothetical protein